MHDSVHVGVFERLQDHVGVQSDVHVVESARQNFSLNVRNVLEDESRRLGGGISEDVVELDDVGAAVESLQNLDFAVLLFDADGLQNFDHTLLVVLKICPLEHFRVLAAAQLLVAIVPVELSPV